MMQCMDAADTKIKPTNTCVRVRVCVCVCVGGWVGGATPYHLPRICVGQQI